MFEGDLAVGDQAVSVWCWCGCGCGWGWGCVGWLQGRWRGGSVVEDGMGGDEMSNGAEDQVRRVEGTGLRKKFAAASYWLRWAIGYVAAICCALFQRIC